MSKTHKIVAIIFGILLVWWLALANLQREELKCSKDTVASLEKIQKICAEEIKENKEKRKNAQQEQQEAQKRNEDIRQMMGRTDKDIVALWLSETK